MHVPEQSKSTYKLRFNNSAKTGFGLMLIAALLTACTSDQEIKADIAVKAKTDPNFAGVTYTVKNKIVTLSGSCPSLKGKQQVIHTIKTIKVIKGLNEQIKIAPVTLTADMPMKQSVDSILSGYAQVTGSVSNGAVTLVGYSTRKEVDKLLPAIKALHPAALDNKIGLISQ